MKKRTKYCQCTLRKTVAPGTVIERVSYIPAKYARVGDVVRLQDDAGEWTDGWIVKTTGEIIESDDLPDSHRAIKHHRKETGDTLPRNS